MWYAKRIVNGEVVSIATYDQNKPVFTDKERLEWEEISMKEYDNILSNIRAKAEAEVEAAKEKLYDVEITDEEV